MAVMTRKQKHSQKALVKQRDTALEAALATASENARLKGNIDDLIGERLAAIETETEARVLAAQKGEREAIAAWQAMKADVKAAAAAEISKLELSVDAARKERDDADDDLREERVLTLQLRVALDEQCAAYTALDSKFSATDLRRAVLEAELASIRSEDVKDLRKRLQAKTQLVQELEIKLAALDPEQRRLRALAGLRPGLTPTPAGLAATADSKP